jgi:hydrogenase expression/formation protein HypE
MTAMFARPLDLRHGRVDMSHGSGGRAMAQLIHALFATEFNNEFLAQGDDGAVLPAVSGRLVMATDAHVVSPLFFPGGDIGCLSVHGTVNDVAVMGAKPLYLSASFVIEEGFPLADLQRIVQSMAQAARDANVKIVTGDTKVVERGSADGVFISTTGVGVLADGVNLSGKNVCVGDVVLLSGDIGAHGMAIMSQRENLSFDAPIVSDTAALHGLVAAMLESGSEIHCMRDATRGGVATTLNEIATQSGVGMMLEESAIPVQPVVAAACEFLGFDPLNVANEGKLLAIVSAESADRALEAMRRHPLGQSAAKIGVVQADAHAFVQMNTRFGGRRIVDWLTEEPLPRIC